MAIKQSYFQVWVSGNLKEDNKVPIYVEKIFNHNRIVAESRCNEYNVDFGYRMLTNPDVRELFAELFEEDFDLFNELYPLYIKLESIAQRADIVRVLYLYLHGGIYIDSDIILLDHLWGNEFNRTDIFCGFERVEKESHQHATHNIREGYCVSNAVIGAIPKHEVFKIYLSRICNEPNINRVSYFKLFEEILSTYGDFQKDSHDIYFDENEKIIIFSNSTFYLHDYHNDIHTVFKPSNNTKCLHIYWKEK